MKKQSPQKLINASFALKLLVSLVVFVVMFALAIRLGAKNVSLSDIWSAMFNPLLTGGDISIIRELPFTPGSRRRSGRGCTCGCRGDYAGSNPKPARRSRITRSDCRCKRCTCGYFCFYPRHRLFRNHDCLFYRRNCWLYACIRHCCSSETKHVPPAYGASRFCSIGSADGRGRRNQPAI